MIEFLDKILIAFDKVEPKGGGTKTSAAPENLFKLNEDYEKLPQNKTLQIPNTMAKNLCATKRARPDTCTAVAFLTTRLQSPNLYN